MIRRNTCGAAPQERAGPGARAAGGRLSGVLAGMLALLACAPAAALAQEPDALADLVARVRAANPEVEGARRLAEAAAARVPQAGALPDPVLSAGLMYVPVPSFDLGMDGMTMGSLQLGQRLPAPGARGAREAIAQQAQLAAEWQAREVELGVVTRLKSAWYEVIFLEGALDVLTRNRALLVDLAEVARARFAVGRTPQQDVLRAQTEVTRLEEQIAGTRARAVAASAEINALLQRPPTAPLQPRYPEEVQALAFAGPSAGAFTAAALAGGLGDGFPSLAELQARALRDRPMLLAHTHRIAAAREAVELARRERLPEVDVMLGWGARVDRGDMMTAMVSVPLPVFAGRKQRQAIVEARAVAAAEELGHHQMVADIQAEVATRYAALVRTREQILLLSGGVIPQARATIESATAAYQAGSVEFASLLEAQATLFRNEIDLARRLADFGRELAALERATGMDLIGEVSDDDR